MRKLWLPAITIVLAAASACSSSKPAATPSQPPAGTQQAAVGCDDNAVVYCGGQENGGVQSDTYGLVYRIQHGDTKHSAKALQLTYAHFFRMPAAKFLSMLRHAKAGYLTQSGEVRLGGKVVAFGAFFFSRQQPAGGALEIAGLWANKPDQLARPQAPAYIAFDSSGRFALALLAENGDPVRAEIGD